VPVSVGGSIRWDGARESIAAAVERICRSGVMKGGRFVMIAANNLAPFTPVENIQALYEATKKYGQYPQDSTR
jgi:uroporphyrinogen-III decarboxylase